MIDKLPLPCLAQSDIVIAGAGPSGISAALAAARQGFKVLLLEQTGALGGMATSGLVPMFAPSSDGIRVLYGGIFPEIHEEMCRRMKCDINNGWQIINAEILFSKGLATGLALVPMTIDNNTDHVIKLVQVSCFSLGLAM